MLEYPGVPQAYYLPTYGLFEDMLVPKFDEMFEMCKIKYKHNKSSSKITTEYGEIWMRSMDNPDNIISYSVGRSTIDEPDLVHINKRANVMKRITARNSFKKSTPNQIDYVCTPEGYAYMYNFFVKKANDNKLLLNLSTVDNEKNLAEGYIEGLREQYTEDQLRAYLNGEFVSLTSRPSYYSFDRFRNDSKIEAKSDHLLFIGMDFNVGNMHAVIHIKINGDPIAVDEITGAYDTPEMIQIIKEKYKNKIIVYPDASGKARKTVDATRTDISLLKQAGFQIKARSVNPSIKDRVKNMNRMFCDGNGKRRYKVNTKKCPEYTEALEKITTDKNGIPDKTSGYDHITEAGGYFIHYEYPVKKHGYVS